MISPKLSDIHIYPIKSTAGISLSTSWVDELGLSFDRRFVVSDDKGQFITARTKSILCLIKTTLTDSGIILSAPNMPLLTLEYKNFSTKYQNVCIWGDTVLSQHCGQKAKNWFSQFLQRSCHLLFFGQKSLRERTSKNNTNKRQVAFADGYPLLLISQASLNDLNHRLLDDKFTPVEMAQFRPNITVDNCDAFAEDTWSKIQIGEVQFKVSKPCERCIFTTINLKNAKRDANKQPLNTLSNYRKTIEGKILFGQNLIPLTSGKIKKGDRVTIVNTQKPPELKNNKTRKKLME